MYVGLLRCDDGWIKFQESCYLRVNDRMKWLNAQETCEEKEANLVTVNSEDEMIFLGSIMGSKGSWIGLKIKAKSIDLLWSSGETSDYRNWAKAGPKRKSRLPRCIQMAEKRKGLKWRATRCSVKYRFICEKGQ